MSGIIPRNLKKSNVSTSNRFPGVHKRGIHTHTYRHTHRHTHMSIAIGEMQCVAFRLKKLKICNQFVKKCYFFIMTFLYCYG